MSNILLKISVSLQVDQSDNNQLQGNQDQANLRYTNLHQWSVLGTARAQVGKINVAVPVSLLAISQVYLAQWGHRPCQFHKTQIWEHVL